MERLSFNDYENKIKLKYSINNILKKSKNEKLKEFCNSYMTALANGKSEANLYESFISGASKWNYINSVDTELSAIAKRIDKYKQEIDFTKIINIMKESDSSYIVPLIEEVVINYINDKNSANRTILKDRLMCFHFDPFVNEMLNILYYDHALSESFDSNFKNDILNNKISINKVYSPLYFIKENECVFNVNGTYYVRKGSTINRLNRTEVAALDESFKKLCNIINSSNVVINEDNTISFVDDSNIATILENAININGTEYTINEAKENLNIARLTNNTTLARTYDVALYLNENFNNIAYVNFVKHVESNVNESLSFDIFKLKNNLFVNTRDTKIGNATFYRNVNPIQLSNIINEHMNMNVSNLFEDLQPNQNKIKKEIDETLNSYEKYISELEDKKTQLESCKESCSDDDLADVTEAIANIDAELEKTKADYSEYQKMADKFLNGEGEDDYAPDYSDDVDDDNDNNDDYLPSDDVATPIEDATDEPAEYDGLFDETTSEDVAEYAPQVVKVSYKTNIKSGVTTNSGEVHILIPSVNANGDVNNELQKITFMLDADKNPIINNDYMPVAIYNLIKNAIESDPNTANIDVDAVANDIMPDVDGDENADDINVEPSDDINPIDDIYGTDDIETEAPDVEPSDIKDEIESADSVIEEPHGTDNPEPEDLEASMVIKGLLTLEIEDYDLSAEGVDKHEFIDYLNDKRISYSLLDNGISVNIRDAYEAKIVKDFFLNLGWDDKGFYEFFEELKIYEEKNESVVVRYSAKIENLLESNNLAYKISKRGDKIKIMNAISEGVLITVTDDKTGKTVKINTEELDSNSDVEDNEKNTQDVVTFDDSKNAQSSEDAEKNSDAKNESTTKKPVFKIKKMKTDESLGLSIYKNKLNENGEEIDVMDEVKYKNENGNVISKLNTGEIIISMNNGSTNKCRPSQVKLVNDKFKEANVSEMVKCGVFMNDVCLTPDNCLTDLSEFNKADFNDEITITVEGVKQLIDKRFVKLMN